MSFKFYLKYFLIFLCFYFQAFSCVFARYENDFGLWTAINGTIPIGSKFENKFQISPRFLDNATGFNQFIIHELLGYKFNKHLSFYQGYAWSTYYIPRFIREQRPYNDLVVSHNVDKFSFEHRLRLEERFIQDVDGVSLRARYRLKGLYPLGKSKKWSLVFFDELFFNLNSPHNGPNSGIDQNRIYAGILRKLTDNFSIEGGYQLQQRLTPGPNNPYKADLLNHFLVIYLNYRFPNLIESKN